MQCHSSVVLAPLIVVSCFTVVPAPHDGQGGGGVDLMVLSGIRERRSYHPLCEVPALAQRLLPIAPGRIPMSLRSSINDPFGPNVTYVLGMNCQVKYRCLRNRPLRVGRGDWI